MTFVIEMLWILYNYLMMHGYVFNENSSCIWFTEFDLIHWLQVSTQFLKMETLLDDSVHHKVELQIERGGKPLTMNLTVRYNLI